MRKILIIGAGRSSSSLIKYLLNKSSEEDLQILVGDVSIDTAKQRIANHPNGMAIALDVFDEGLRKKAVRDADIVVSMLPARFHLEVAKDCLTYGKHMVTASYISEEMKALNDEVKANKLVFMNEIGVDPGIDHMSAMQVIDRIRDNGAKMLLFESFTGGLVAPESDTNLWNYKFTWNPRNVVLAGQGGAAKFIQEGTYKYIPYHKLFRRTEFLTVNGTGK
nr:saccharopine dehydrogenase C-terminal domain-containing protein [Flavobacteriaceae bacterium]